MAAHPRSRGENHYEYARPETVKGSSPLTRGKPLNGSKTPLRDGLIPAHAGKTAPFPTMASNWRAHPRSRGENSDESYRAALADGSSPLTRGKPNKLKQRRVRNGLIPAHAGKTPAQHPHDPRQSAHPRSRGENVTINQGWDRLEGSSPLTRGKQRSSPDAVIVMRLIPAHAGKTLPDLRFYRADRSDLGKP